MSRRNKIRYKFWDAQSITATVTWSGTNISYLEGGVAIQLNVTTTGNDGQFAVQVSNDNSNWSDLTLDPIIPALASANTNIFINISDLNFEYLRVKFTQGSVTTNGTVTGWIVAK